MTPEIQAFWEAFKAKSGEPANAPFDIFSIGSTTQSADEGLQLILDGIKTTTSCLPEEFADSRPPQAGDLSIVLDGRGKPGAVVETVSIIPTPFKEIDADFAYAYGEWDRTLETWQKNNRSYYQHLCEQFELQWSDERILLCETFRLMHPIGGG